MQTRNRSRPTPKTIVQQLARIYAQKGYVRRQNRKRFAKEGSSQYKKGDEIRLIADSRQELKQIRQLLEKAGFKPGRPYGKGNKHCQPVYGKGAVARFLKLVRKRERR